MIVCIPNINKLYCIVDYKKRYCHRIILQVVIPECDEAQDILVKFLKILFYNFYHSRPSIE